MEFEAQIQGFIVCVCSLRHRSGVSLCVAVYFQGTWHNLKHELLSNLMPIFLGNHPNSAIVLQYAWHCQVTLQLSGRNTENSFNTNTLGVLVSGGGGGSSLCKY